MRSGLVLDRHDDVDGSRFLALFPRLEDVPEIIKTAEALSIAETHLLPDDLFALILHDGDQHLRKYACIDAGNTVLNINYFLQSRGLLEEDAQKTAAQNFLVACSWYGLEAPEELRKIASLDDAVFKGLSIAGKINSVQGAAEGLASGHDALQRNGGLFRTTGGHILTPDEAEMHRLKTAEASGTNLMSTQPQKTGPAVTVPVKTAGTVGRQVPGHSGEQGNQPDILGAVPGKQPAQPQYVMHPHVSVKKSELPVIRGEEKKASKYALRGRYPLDSYEEVKTAAAYFDQYKTHFSPEDRHAYCQAVLPRAQELLLPVSEDMRTYGSSKYASVGQVLLGLDSRRTVLSDPSHLEVLGKIASAYGKVSPEEFAEALGTFDKLAGLDRSYDRGVLDPYVVTFGAEKTAADRVIDYSFVSGNDFITGRDIERAAHADSRLLRETFNTEILEGLRKDPVGIFESLPLPQKRILMRIASDKSEDGGY